MKEISFLFKSRMGPGKVGLAKFFLLLFGIVLILIFSGAGYTNFEMSFAMKVTLYILSFGYFFCLFIWNFNIEIINCQIRKKKAITPSIYTIGVMTCLFLGVLSFVFNPNQMLNINGYISFFLTISVSWLVIKTFSPSFVLKTFKNTIFVLSLLSLVFFLITFFSREFFSLFYFTNGVKILGTHLFVNNDYVSGLTYSLFWRLRLTSSFWEPSVFGIMLVAALVCDIFSQDKLTPVRSIISVFSIALTQSTSAFILLIPILFLFLSRKTRGLGRFFVFLAFIVFCLASFVFFNPIITVLAKIFPNVFGKFLESSSTLSFTTRLLSFRNYLLVFIKRPIFGFGSVSASAEYYAISDGLVDAETSTFGLAMASLGLAGVLLFILIFAGILMNKGMPMVTRIILAILLFLASNAQGQGSIWCLNILYWLPLSMVPLPKKASQRNQKILTFSSKRTIRDILFSKNDAGDVSRNIVFSLILKGFSIVLAFFTIPIYLKYFDNNNSTYGVWATITSLLSIITVFDLGMGNGLKNKLIENIAKKDETQSKVYVSTIYLFTALIGFVIFAVSTITIFSLSDAVISKVFFKNQPFADGALLSFRIGASIVFLAIGLQFCLKNISYVLQAHQRNAITGVFALATNMCLLIFAYCFSGTITSSQKIVYLASAYCLFLNLPLLIASLILFAKKYKNLAPSFKFVNFQKSKAVINVGIQFFVVQLGTLVLWSLNEFIILFAFNYEANLVTEYNEYYKLFSLLPTILGTVIQQPVWSAISKAKAENNKQHIKNNIFFLAGVTIVFSLANLLLLFVLGPVFNFWLGASSAPEITLSKKICFAIYSTLYLSSISVVVVLNALSLFKSQIATSILALVLKIPVIFIAVLLLHISMGWEIVILVNSLCYLPILVFGPMEIKKQGLGKGAIEIRKCSI